MSDSTRIVGGASGGLVRRDALQQGAQCQHVDRLGQVRLEPSLGGALQVTRRGPAGERDRRHGDASLAHGGHQLVSGHIRHADVDNGEVEGTTGMIRRTQRLQGLPARGTRHGPVAKQLEDHHEAFAHVDVVIDDENMTGRHGSGTSWRKAGNASIFSSSVPVPPNLGTLVRCHNLWPGSNLLRCVVDSLTDERLIVSRSVSSRHMAAAASVSHGLRNLLAPAQLRLDAWLLRGSDVAVGEEDLARMRALLRDMVHIVDGLDMLRLAPTELPAGGMSGWPASIGALLSCIAAGAPSTLDVEGGADASSRIPVPLVAHVLVDLALAAQAAAPRSSSRYRVEADTKMVRVHAAFAGVAPDTMEQLATAVQRAIEDALPPSVRASARIVVVVDELSGDVACHVDVPTVSGLDTQRSGEWSRRDECQFSVLCIDDNEHLLDALEERLRHADGFSHFLRSRSVTEALAQLEQAQVSLVLIDVHLDTAHDPFAAIALVRAQCPGARVALFSGRVDHGLMERAMTHGADGFVFKGLPSHDLVDAIVRLARGEHVWVTEDA